MKIVKDTVTVILLGAGGQSFNFFLINLLNTFQKNPICLSMRAQANSSRKELGVAKLWEWSQWVSFVVLTSAHHSADKKKLSPLPVRQPERTNVTLDVVIRRFINHNR